MTKLFIYATCFLMLFSCKEKTKQEAKAKVNNDNEVTFNEVQIKNSSIVVGFPTMQNISQQLKITGVVDVPPSNLVSVSFPLGGYVKSIKLLPGEQVRKGQIIAELEDQNYVLMQQEYLTAKAKLEYLSSDLQRQKNLSENDASSKKNYQLILSQYNEQQVALHALYEKLKIININPNRLNIHNLTIDRPIYAPIDGFVSQVNVNIGQYVTPSDVLVTLINPDDLHASMSVFEKDMASFHEGLDGCVFLNEDSSKKYPVKVILVSRNLDQTGKGLVHCHFEGKEEPHLIPGTFLNGIFAIGGGKSVSVPEDAVVRYFGKDYVFLTTDNKRFRLQEVSISENNVGLVALKPLDNIDWLKTKIALQGAYSLLGALKNKMEDD